MKMTLLLLCIKSRRTNIGSSEIICGKNKLTHFSNCKSIQLITLINQEKFLEPVIKKEGKYESWTIL